MREDWIRVNGFRCGSMSESSVLDAIDLLRQKGADVRYHDPYVPSIRHNGFEMAGEPDPEAALRLRSGQGIGRGGLRGVLTDHSCYDWAAVRQQVRLSVDTRHTTS